MRQRSKDKGQGAENGILKSFVTAHNLLFPEKGIALMMVLWVLVLLSILSLNYFSSNRWNSASTRNFKEETVAYYMAMSAYQEAVNYILSDKDPSVDFIDAEGNYWTDTETEPVSGKRDTEEGEIEISITDENAKLNINYADEFRLRKLFKYAGIPEEAVTEIIDSMMDWKDADTEHHLSGAEDEYYEGLTVPYKAKNMLFDVPEELTLVKGMKPEYFDRDRENSLLRLITTFGGNTLNINTVSKEVLQMLEFDDTEIEAIMKQRNKDSGGFRFIPQQFSAKGLNVIASQNVRVEVLAKPKNAKLAGKIVAVLTKRPSAAGYKIHTVYWREHAENIRG
ncbi:MAG: general secretion pathway protein GspK [Nitrospirota bacterium]|nr:general secretion pathway protein GspK [Nitrospirota bacterium]